MCDHILTAILVAAGSLMIGLVIGVIGGKELVVKDCEYLEKFRYSGEVYECKLIK